jgi:hypothetical protein
MKLKIRETSEKINYINTENSVFNFFKFKIIQVIKYILLYTD